MDGKDLKDRDGKDLKDREGKDSPDKPEKETCSRCGGFGTIMSGGDGIYYDDPCPSCSPQPPSSSCFVASVVYDNPHAPEVETLRQFRDNVLERSGLGRKIICLYYGGWGERVAEIIEEQFPFAIPAIKTGLDYLVERYQKYQKEK